MFGYVLINKEELKFKEYDVYINRTIVVYAKLWITEVEGFHNLH